jgi:oligopeptide/dipeptide ABC transporter ATP-binding protein
MYTMKEPLISIHNLSKTYSVGKKEITAIHDLSLHIDQAETLGLVGESGCGKTTTGRCLLRLENATSGEIFYEKKPLLNFNSQELFSFRREAQIIFQDPYSSLNPRMTASDIIAEPLRIHNTLEEKQIPSYIADLVTKVGLSPSALKRFPHEFSGGQRQRIGIARALALKPRFIVCDEPISALDVPIQAQIINLLKDLQREFGLTYLFITHNLAMVKYISDRIAVMYLGHLVEICAAEELYLRPLHPYTQALLAAIPPMDPTKRRPALEVLHKEPSSSKGCPFANRCPHVTPRCHQERPHLKTASTGHQVACHLY